MASGELVLVTGGSGFVGSHCILAALARGYRVRTTVRSLERADEVRQMLKTGGASDDKVDGVEFCAVDLKKDDGWPEACKDCVYVLHVASPFPAAPPKDENEVIIPAREGTLRALRAAKTAGTVKRVVFCSSFAAVGYGHPDRDGQKLFTEEDWTILDEPTNPVPAYQKSKTVAERAAFDYIAKEGGDLELSVVNPVGIFGPILRAKDYSTSIELIVRCMKLTLGVVDVRDVADLHLRAMVDPKAKGERYIAVTGDSMISVQEIAQTLKQKLGEKAKKVPTRSVPNWVLRFVGLFDAAVSLVVPELGKYKNATNEKATTQLGWQPRSAEDALVATAESLEKFGLLK